MSRDTVLRVQNVWKSYPSPAGNEPLDVLEDIALEIGRGEIVTLIGPSGCGKSTVLNLIAGFDTPDKGTIFFDKEPVTAPSAKRGVVFQSPVLFPWLTVKQNIAYGLKLRKSDRSLIDEKCKEFINLVGLDGFEHYYPHQFAYV